MDESSSDDDDNTSAFGQKKRDRETLLENCQARSFKKARFAWQIKGDSRTKATDTFDNEKCVLQENSTSSVDNSKYMEHTDKDLCACSMYGNEDVGSLKEINTDKRNRENKCDLENYSSKKKYLDIAVEDRCSASLDVLHSSDCVEGNLSPSQLHRERVNAVNSAYWQRRSPFDVLRTTVNIASNTHSLSTLWQKEELGCAIVDNVFNRTLEEIGISPAQKGNKVVRILERALENQGIETAIRQQGLTTGMTVSQSCVTQIVSNSSCHGDNGTFSSSAAADTAHETLVKSDVEMESRPGSSNGSVNSLHGQSDGVYVEDSSSKNGHNSNSSTNKSPGTDEQQIVLDLAVSAAIFTQGLNVNK